MTSKRIKVIIIIIFFFIYNNICIASTDISMLFYDKSLRNIKNDEIVKVSEAFEDNLFQNELSFQEMFDYGTLLFLQNRHHESLSIYKVAVSKTNSSEMKSLSLMMAAESASLIERYKEAGELANHASKLFPKNKGIATKRYIYWKQAGDRFNEDIAMSHLKRLEVELQGKKTAISIGAVIIATISVIGGTYILVEVVKKTDPEILPKVILGILKAFAKGAELAICLGLIEGLPPIEGLCE